MLASHPGVREVAVIGAPDDRLGSRVVAVVVGDATPEELDAHCLASPSPASSARASTVWWRRSRRAHRERSCAESCATNRRRASERVRRIPGRARRRARRGDDHAGRAGEVQPGLDARARPARGALRRARPRRRGAVRRAHRGRRPVHRRRRHRRVPDEVAVGCLPAREERRRSRALLEARDREARGLRVRGRDGARARVRLPDRCRRHADGAPRGDDRDDPRLGRHAAARPARRARSREGHRHARPPRQGRGGARDRARHGGRRRRISSTARSTR